MAFKASICDVLTTWTHDDLINHCVLFGDI